LRVAAVQVVAARELGFLSGLYPSSRKKKYPGNISSQRSPIHIFCFRKFTAISDGFIFSGEDLFVGIWCDVSHGLLMRREMQVLRLRCAQDDTLYEANSCVLLRMTPFMKDEDGVCYSSLRYWVDLL
jgi:hypothetical protein